LIRSLQDEQDAADLAQETFARVYQHRAKFDPRQKFTTWLYAIAGNLVRDRYRWRARHPQVSLQAQAEPAQGRLQDHLPALAPSPDQSLQTRERADAVRQAVATLPEELRQPLLLAVYEELPQAEIATVLKCSVKAVETRIYRARQRLRPTLARFLEAP
jgi:RNA polymerase sigma-70 factor (ECF subfamily)